MPDVTILASGLGFPEGPVWMADGSVILGEISGKKVTREVRAAAPPSWRPEPKSAATVIYG